METLLWRRFTTRTLSASVSKGFNLLAFQCRYWSIGSQSDFVLVEWQDGHRIYHDYT